jgi:hypothetical protein
MQTAHAIKGKTVFNNSTLSPNPEKPEITNYNIQISDINAAAGLKSGQFNRKRNFVLVLS